MLLGVLFIVSAVAKLVEIDTFELYIFSYHLLPLTLSFLAARLVIVAEMLCGIGLLANIWKRGSTLPTSWASHWALPSMLDCPKQM